MQIGGENTQSIWYDVKSESVKIIDQTLLPHKFEIVQLETLSDVCHAICTMKVRGAPLIGVTAAYGIYLALRENPKCLRQAISELLKTRPTAVNLRWALNRMEKSLREIEEKSLAAKALEHCQLIEKEDIAVCEAIGENGLPIFRELWENRKGSQKSLNILMSLFLMFLCR